MSSLLELVKKANKEADHLLLLDQHRLENISVPELNVPEEQIFEWFEQVKEKVQREAETGVRKAQVFLYEIEERHATERTSLGEIAEWIETCVYQHKNLENWNFSSKANIRRAQRKFLKLQEKQTKKFSDHILQLWIDFDSSLVPKIEKSNSSLFYVAEQNWNYGYRYNCHGNAVSFPRFKLSFDWREEEEPPSKKACKE